MAFTILLALNNLLPHRYTTTHLAFIGFVIRDTIFTVYLARHYFQLQNTALLGEVTIQRLEGEKEQLKRIEQIKTAFFNNVSHELRTPLTLILSPLQSSLESKQLPDDVRKELDLSLKNGKYLLQLVNEMLDLAKLDEGELQLVRRPVEVIQHTKNIRDTFVQYATCKQQILYISHAEHTLTANIDIDKFEKIVINLLSNAIKYSDGPGNITLKIAVAQRDLLLEVEDQGRGISADELPRIFDRYFQSDEVDKSEGTGIGLSIVKEFVTLHGGAVTCTSQPGVGSVFSLRFTDCIVVNEVSKLVPTPPQAYDPDKQTLLIVEDQEDMRDYLGSKFPEYNVALAPNGAEALKELEAGLQPHLMLTDFMMPKMNGYELVRTLRKSESWLSIPVIFLTARTLAEDKLKVLNLGVDDYIIKPFNLHELKVRIKNTIELGKTRVEASHSISSEMTLASQTSFKEKLDSFLLDHLDDQNLSNIDLSDHFNLSERNLYRRIKAVTGQSPASYIKEIRLQKTRRLLVSSADLTINEVARLCGMYNPTYFSKAFKKRFGTSPSKFRNVESM